MIGEHQPLESQGPAVSLFLPVRGRDLTLLLRHRGRGSLGCRRDQPLQTVVGPEQQKLPSSRDLHPLHP